MFEGTSEGDTLGVLLGATEGITEGSADGLDEKEGANDGESDTSASNRFTWATRSRVLPLVSHVLVPSVQIPVSSWLISAVNASTFSMYSDPV